MTAIFQTMIALLTSVQFNINGLGGMASVPETDGDHPIIFIMSDTPHLLSELDQTNVLAFWLDFSGVGKETKDLTAAFEIYRTGINRWLQGEAPELGMSIMGKGNFSQTVFIAYDHYADAALEIAQRQHHNQMDISELLLLSPKRTEQADQEFLPDVPITLLLKSSLLQENIVSLTYFQSLKDDPLRKAPATIYFAEPQSPQSKFQEFTCQFLLEHLQERPDKPSKTVPSQRFGMGLKYALHLADDTLLLDPSQFADPHENPYGKNHFDNLTVNHYQGLTDRYHLEGEPSATFTMEFHEAVDMSNREALALYFNYANERQSTLDFALEFKDMEGQSERVNVVNQRPFNYGVDALIPFYQERILLESLQVVDLTSISSISLIFEKGITGEFNIGEMALSGYKDAPCGEY